ncbi:amidohydrolase [Rhodobacteraceae bacterium B1Z28]|uniref:Amidohydrolase n=1 Tax=Ruegeria haliotis TaxID=2747601 RepID=A0ABX2PRA3_9RHOB|nr:amidohydrolase [Ruegeria haliotis]NVO56650.1 amidohydrolase [Ruegeria haliotis]
MGIEVHGGIGKTGIVGLLRNGSSNRSVLLRADMDALPIWETSSHEYASLSNGVMHACGHDGHMSMLLGAAKFLSETRPFDGTVIFLFQPDEEQGRGAKAMLDDGLVARFEPNEAYAIHNLPAEPLGRFSTRVGNICASESLFEIEIKAQGGHAAMPHTGVDAIVVGAELVQSLQTIVARKLAPASGAVVSITDFVTDGRRNVLPGHATITGDTRTRSPEDTQRIEALMRQIAAGVAAAHDVEIKVSFRTEFDVTINSSEQVVAAVQVASGLGCETEPNRAPMSFSEDFGRLSTAIPGCFILMGNGTEGAHAQPLHASDYDFNDEALPIGAAFWARLVAERLPLKETPNV